MNQPGLSVKAIRQRLGLSPVEFSLRFGIDPRTLEEWEAGRSRPDAAAYAYLLSVERHPECVREKSYPAHGHGLT